MRRTRVVGAWAFASFCAGCWYLYETFVEQRPWGNQSDFTWYYMAAREIAHKVLAELRELSKRFPGDFEPGAWDRLGQPDDSCPP